MDHQPAAGRRQVEGLAEADDRAATGGKLVEEHQEVAQGPTEAIEAEDQDLADGAGPGGGAEGAPPYGPACLTGNNSPFTGRDLVYAFTATQTTHTATVTTFNHYAAVLFFLRPPPGGSCSPEWCEQVSHQPHVDSPETIAMQGLVPGQTYYLVVDARADLTNLYAGIFTLLVQ